MAVGSNRGALIKKADMFDSESVNAVGKQDENTEALKNILADALKPLASELEKINTYYEKLIEESLEEIKTLLTPDQDGLGRSLLGDPRNQSIPAGAKETAERIETQLKAINTTLGV